MYQLNIGGSPNTFLDNISDYKDDWKQYNPSKDINRKGLSITSLDGGFSGIPDLDSLREYSIKTGNRIDEIDITTKTPIYEHAKHWLEPFEPWMGRTHIIELGQGGYFPPHRDAYSRDVTSFRLFIPLKYCNPPNMHFILDGKILNFDHGHIYFIDTCLEHTLFTTNKPSTFIVANIRLCDESIDKVLEHLYVV